MKTARKTARKTAPAGRRPTTAARAGIAILIALSGLAIVGQTATTPPAAASTTTAPSIADPLTDTVWLCRPGASTNPCNQNLDGSPQRGAGSEFTARYLGSHADVTLDAINVTDAPTHESFEPPTSPEVDCFFVYPTVDLTPNPLLQIGALPPQPSDTHLAVTLTQVARFSNSCRLFVPVYRQAPLLNLVAGVLTGTETDYTTGAMDIATAWADYWEHDNIDPVTGERRGVLLLGHSQGTANLVTLLQDEFDPGTAERSQLVAAYLLGGDVLVGDGTGPAPLATIPGMPACARASGTAPIPTGCMVGYSSFTMPPGSAPAADATFSRSTAPGHRMLCVNPAALVAGSDAGAATPLDTYLPTNRLLEGTVVLPNGHLSVVLSGFALENRPAGFVRREHTLTGQCRVQVDASGTASWLQVTGGASLFPAESSTSGLGLHVVDYNVALGDLTELAGLQSAQWTAQQ